MFGVDNLKFKILKQKKCNTKLHNTKKNWKAAKVDEAMLISFNCGKKKPSPHVARRFLIRKMFDKDKVPADFLKQSNATGLLERVKLTSVVQGICLYKVG